MMLEKTIVSVFTFVFTTLFLVGYTALGAWIGALVLRDLWSWFIVPLWPMLWELQLSEAVGISMVVGFLTHQTYLGPLRWTKEDGTIDTKRWLGGVLQTIFITPGSFWIIGYTVHKIWGA